MEDRILNQLFELTKAFNEKGIDPVICGGLGIYLYFKGRATDLPLRTTSDIDIMLTRSQVDDQTKRLWLDEIIYRRLEYDIGEEGKYFQFHKGNGQTLDILIQPVDAIEDIETKDFRAKIVPSRLHGYRTIEAEFIDEDLIKVKLYEIFPENKKAENLTAATPSLTNFLLLKLFAFNDRTDGPRQNDNQAQNHAFDIYVILSLVDSDDYKTGQNFLKRHNDSQIISKTKRIITKRFFSTDSTGWQCLYRVSSFYPNKSRTEKQEKLDHARRRLLRWFNIEP